MSADADAQGVWQHRTGKVLLYADDVRELVIAAKRTAVKGGALDRAAEKVKSEIDKAEARAAQANL